MAGSRIADPAKQPKTDEEWLSTLQAQLKPTFTDEAKKLDKEAVLKAIRDAIVDAREKSIGALNPELKQATRVDRQIVAKLVRDILDDYRKWRTRDPAQALELISQPRPSASGLRPPIYFRGSPSAASWAFSPGTHRNWASRRAARG